MATRASKIDILKMEQMLHYIINSAGNLSHVGKTVLWKLMYFSDFDYYEIYEEKLTGEQYRKLEHGPAPSNFNIVIKRLKEAKKIRAIQVEYHRHIQEKYVSLKKPDTSRLSKEELEVIDRTITKLGYLNASQISEMSHLDIPWKATKDKEIINYELVFYREPITSVREYNDDDNN